MAVECLKAIAQQEQIPLEQLVAEQAEKLDEAKAGVAGSHCESLVGVK